MANELKVLVIDDTVTDRQIMTKALSSFSNIELLGTASNGKIALTKIGLKKPDLVFLDLIMPEMDGLETLQRIRKQYPNVDVIIVSGIDQENAKITMQALEYGAIDFIPKPKGISAAESFNELKSMMARLIPIAQTRKYSRQVRIISNEKRKIIFNQGLNEHNQPPLIKNKDVPPAPIEKQPIIQPIQRNRIVPVMPAERRKPSRIDIVAIGVSTGGPNALQEIVTGFEQGFPLPIMVVQHMPPMFTASLAARLNNESLLTVVEGQDGMVIENGHLYIAPGGRHMVVRKEQVRSIIGIIDTPPINSCRPSIDVLFRSLAMVYGGNILTAILTGMGSDGMSGVTCIRRKGGYSLVQDEKSSVVWGMPGSVVEAGQADEIVPITDMAERITSIVQGRAF